MRRAVDYDHKAVLQFKEFQNVGLKVVNIETSLLVEKFEGLDLSSDLLAYGLIGCPEPVCHQHSVPGSREIGNGVPDAAGTARSSTYFGESLRLIIAESSLFYSFLELRCAADRCIGSIFIRSEFLEYLVH